MTVVAMPRITRFYHRTHGRGNSKKFDTFLYYELFSINSWTYHTRLPNT